MAATGRHDGHADLRATLLNQPYAVSDRRGLRAGTHVELGEDARDVDARGLLGHVQRGADLAVGAPIGQQGQHLPFAGREPERVFAVIRGR